jgi:hypothetical protein
MRLVEQKIPYGEATHFIIQVIPTSCKYCASQFSAVATSFLVFFAPILSNCCRTRRVIHNWFQGVLHLWKSLFVDGRTSGWIRAIRTRFISYQATFQVAPRCVRRRLIAHNKNWSYAHIKIYDGLALILLSWDRKTNADYFWKQETAKLILFCSGFQCLIHCLKTLLRIGINIFGLRWNQ